MIKKRNKLFIIRGLPGSGKSTIAESLKESGLVDFIVEADQFMLDDKGNYNFKPDKLKFCHEQCQAWVKYHLDNGSNVAVANTFTRIWEMIPYIDMGYPYSVMTAKGNYKNVHGVPSDTIDRMSKRWEDFLDG